MPAIFVCMSVMNHDKQWISISSYQTINSCVALRLGAVFPETEKVSVKERTHSDVHGIVHLSTWSDSCLAMNTQNSFVHN